MHVIYGDNINHAYAKGVEFFARSFVGHGVRVLESRDGPTLEATSPVTTVYGHPCQRILFDPVRNANPFFHFFETLWMLAGREDVKWLSYFLGDIAKYSDDGKRYHGAYGYRLRGIDHDQIGWVIRHLHEDPNSRRATLSIFSHLFDHRPSKDIPCNTTVSFSLRAGRLHMTVFCRSNDMLWGAYGANVVQFSTIQELIAACLGVQVGTYTQISNSFHVYTARPLWKEVIADYQATGRYAVKDPYQFETQIDNTPIPKIEHYSIGTGNERSDKVQRFEDKPSDRYANFTHHLTVLMRAISTAQDTGRHVPFAGSGLAYFEDVATGMFNAFQYYKQGRLDAAIEHANLNVAADDWRWAAILWLNRIRVKREAR